MGRIMLFNKPFGVICQFSRDGMHPTLADYIPLPDFYPAGRLDTDSEGLLVLTDDGRLQHLITDPKHKLPKTYWAQVEGVADDAALVVDRRPVVRGQVAVLVVGHPARGVVDGERRGEGCHDRPESLRRGGSAIVDRLQPLDDGTVAELDDVGEQVRLRREVRIHAGG